MNEIELQKLRCLGWSISCPLIDPGADLGRDLALTTGPNGLDLARVEAIDCVTQALSIALTTRLGDDLFNVAFGFDGVRAMAEETNPILVRERIRVAVIQTLRQEARVRRIVDVKLEDDRLNALTAGSRVVEVRVAFDVETGDRINLTLGSFAANA